MLFKIEGFVTLLGKAVGMLLQQILSLMFEALLLVFKIINAVEVYIVLLIDALTGKISSDGKIATLAIGVLSIASYYTTFTGMNLFMEQDTVVMLITLGIQAILFSTSLRIGNTLKMDAETEKKFKVGILMPVSGFICITGCIAAYVIKMLNVPFTTRKFLYSLLYLIVIMCVLFIIFLLVWKLIKAESRNHTVGTFLFLIYFAVLSVSSFFSYNAFITVMYPEEIRSVDMMMAYRTGIIEVLEQVQEDANDHYKIVAKEINNKLTQLETNIKTSSEDTFLNSEKKKLYKNVEEYKQYLQYKKNLKKKREKILQLEQDYDEERYRIYEYSGGIGAQTTLALKKARETYNQKRYILVKQKRNIKDKIEKNFQEIVQNEKKYQALLEKIENNASYQKDITTIKSFLKKEDLNSEEETQLEKAIQEDEITEDNNLKDMIILYISYNKFQNIYEDSINTILSMITEAEQYDVNRHEIRNQAYTVLENLPLEKYVSKNDNKTKKSSLQKSDYYSKVELLYRNADQNINSVERSIRTFIDNKLIGITCAVLALLIDMMILFVGLILPKDIHFWDKHDNYSEQDIKKLLSNLFNKPIRR